MGVAIRKVEGWGWLGVGTSEKGVAKIVLPKKSKGEVESALTKFETKSNQKLAQQCAEMLSQYLKGEDVALENIPVDWTEITETYRKILQTLQREVGIGQTVTYKELACICGFKKGARLIGQAMAENPVPLLVPCHRVICSDGSLGGFSGGVNLKKRLLDLEGKSAQKS